jgi:uncharacterized protein YbaP (TraB family)
MASCGQRSTLDKVDADGQSLLWLIERSDLKEPSYLFGTMHAIPEDRFHMGARLQQLAAESDIVVLELDMDDINLFAYAKQMMLPDGLSLQEVMKPEDYQLARSVLLDSLGISQLEWMGYSKMKPIFVMSGVVKGLMGEIKEYEIELVDIAQDNNVEVVGLEEPEEQLAFLDTITIEDQVDMLLEGLQEMDSLKWYLDRVIGYYGDQNLDSIESLLHDPRYAELMEYEDPLIYDRNKRWVAQMNEIMADGQALVAVGAAHLVGEQGLLALLRQEGYTLTPILTD